MLFMESELVQRSLRNQCYSCGHSREGIESQVTSRVHSTLLFSLNLLQTECIYTSKLIQLLIQQFYECSKLKKV